MPAAEIAHRLEKLGFGRNQVHVSGHRLDDDRRDAWPVFGKGALELGDIVVVEDQRMPCQIRRNAAGTGAAEGQQARTGFHQQAVAVSVITALELDQQVAPGEATRQANGAHRRFGTRADQTHHLERRQQTAQQVGHVDFALGRRAEGQASRSGLLHGNDHFRMGVAKDQRPPRADVVKINFPIGIGHP